MSGTRHVFATTTPDRIADPPLPTDITGRTVIYRRRGIIASAVAAALAVWSARRQLARITRQYRRLPAEDLPDHLREDIGLPPVTPHLPPRTPWETIARWK